MADATLITSLSRRAILAGGAVSIAAPAAALSAAIPPAALPAVALPVAAPPFAGPDGALLRLVAAAERYRAAYDRADAECARRFEAMRRHPDYPRADLDTPEARALWEDLAGRLGILHFDDGCLHLYERYGAAVRAVFELPARTLHGAGAKLRLGIAALKAEHRGAIDPVDCTYLDGTLADLERLGR